MNNHIKLALMIAALIFSLDSWAIKIKPCQNAECKKYFKAFQKNAKSGKGNAIATLAEFYYHGYGTKKNHLLALKYYRKAARKGVVRAQYKAGIMYILDEKHKDIDKGIDYLNKAAFNDHKNAAYLLGIMHYSTEFGKLDKVEADKWLAKAYTRRHASMPEFIEHIQSFEQITPSNFPKLSKAMGHTPLVAANGQLNWSNDIMEVITVTGPSIESQFKEQLVSMRKRNTSLGSRIQGLNCKEKIGCQDKSPKDMQDFNQIAWKSPPGNK